VPDPTATDVAPPVPGAGDPADAPDLLAARLGDVGEPDTLAVDAAQATLGGPSGEEPPADLGRLGELALWWAGVRGDGRAAAPRQVLMAGADPAVAARRAGATAVPLPDRDGALDVDDALAWGLATADGAADRGVALIVLVLDDPATRPLAADLLGTDAVEATGWPADRGLSDRDWMAEVTALRDRLWALRGLRGRPTDLLRALGSPAVAGAVALLVQAGVRRTPVLLDGPGATAAALLARRAAHPVTAWWQAADASGDPLHRRGLDSLGLVPLTALGVRVSDGTAALPALGVLDQAAALLVAPAEAG